MKNQIICICLLLSLFFISGCCPTYNPDDVKAFVKTQKSNIAPDGYILQPADIIEIRASKIPELHLQKQQIRPDGKVIFEALGELEAAGKTPKELSEIMREKLMLLYALTSNYPVAINVFRPQSRVFYVLGEVSFPGPRLCTGRDSLFRSIADAKPTVLAWQSRVQVIRPSYNINERPKIFEIDFSKMSACGDLSNDVLLEENDIVYLPPTVVSSIAIKIEEFLRPIGRAFSTVFITPTPPTNQFSSYSSSSD